MIPDEYALTIATWEPIDVAGTIHRVRAIRPLKPFDGLDIADGWITAEDWEYVADGSDRPILLIDRVEGLDVVLTVFFSIPGRATGPTGRWPVIVSGDFATEGWQNPFFVSLWWDVLGLDDLPDSFWGDVYEGQKSMTYVQDIVQEIEKNGVRARPRMAYDPSPYLLLGLDMPWLEDQEHFMAWLEGVRASALR